MNFLEKVSDGMLELFLKALTSYEQEPRSEVYRTIPQLFLETRDERNEQSFEKVLLEAEKRADAKEAERRRETARARLMIYDEQERRKAANPKIILEMPDKKRSQ